STNLSDYLSQRYYGQVSQPTKTGSFLTISRLTGCEATEIAADLVKVFKKGGRKWNVVNKEILDKSAEMLHFERQKLEHDFITAPGNVMDEVIKSLSMRYYVSDKKIRGTIADIIRYEARKGNVIIIGRAGVVTTAGIPGGFHVRLVAPLEWRIEKVMNNRNVTREEAEKYIMDSDKKRILFLERFCDKRIQDVCFDIVINRIAFSREQTVDMILNAMNIKGLL
ncbi:MAG: cytidylate kinase-like family protein, partial [Bacteroidales bacterium]|nr:cytidylate kinase-like family protein [Bacteroidales bacterium]